MLNLLPPSPSEETIRRQAEKVFARPEFAPQRDWLLEMIRDFLGWLGTLHASAPVLFWLLLVGCVVLLLLIVAHIAWIVHRAFYRGERHRPDRAQERRAELSVACWELARTRAAEGEFTEAIRYLFLSLVYRFDETGRVNFEHAYTNREYLGLFADRPAAYSQLKVFVDTLDDHWYGQHPTAEMQYEQCLALYQTLNRQG